MSKQKNNQIISLVCFIIFVVWAIAMLLNCFDIDAEILDIVLKIANIAAFVFMAYYAYCYYAANKKNTVITVLFWIAAIVGVVAIILPLFGVEISF